MSKRKFKLPVKCDVAIRPIHDIGTGKLLYLRVWLDLPPNEWNVKPGELVRVTVSKRPKP